MIMHLDYEFELDGKVYHGNGVDIGDTIDLEAEAKDVKGLRNSAVCHAFDLTVGYDEEKIEELTQNAKFAYCELRI